MAEAGTGGKLAPAIGSHGLRKALSWKDGLAVAMVMPAGVPGEARGCCAVRP